MSIFQKVTLQSLKKNKTRTAVTIIGVILSAAMICAVTTFASSIRNYLLEIMIYTNGDWHGSTEAVDWNTYETVASTEEVSDAFYSQQIGYAIAEGCENEYKPYLYVLGSGDHFVESMPIHLTAGELPKGQDEILLPNHLAENGGVHHKLGDILTLELGSRMSAGFDLNQFNPFLTQQEGGEELVVKENRTYTVVGFYDRPSFENYSAPGYTAITLADAEPNKDALYDVYFKLHEPENVEEFLGSFDFQNYSVNSDVLMCLGVSLFTSFYTVLYSLAAIVIGLIMFGSISLIYNAFSISVSERTKQFGLLSSIGATRHQLRRMVLFEALAVGAVGIPLGIASGIAGIAVTLYFIGDKFTALGYPIAMHVSVSAVSVVIAVLVSLLTVMISAWIPSRRATKVSAVEAIRQNKDIQVKGKQVKTSKLIYKLFGLPGVLANKHYKRSRKKYRATIVSLVMSIVLFVSASSFSQYLMDSVQGSFYTYEYDLEYFCNPSLFDDISADAFLQMTKQADSVKDGAYVIRNMYQTKIPLSSMNQDVLKHTGVDEPIDGSKVSVNVFYLFVDDSSFRELLAQNNQDPQKYFDPAAPLAVVSDGGVVFSSNDEKFVNIRYLNTDTCQMEAMIRKQIDGYELLYTESDEQGKVVYVYTPTDGSEGAIRIPEEEAYTVRSIQTGCRITQPPFYCPAGGHLSLMYPVSMMEQVLPEMGASSSYLYYYVTEDHNIAYESIKQILNENGFPSNALFDYAKENESTRNTVTIIQVFSYGFIILISLIAAANVFNTISTNISLRRREFAMLKSVGMSDRDFNKMMNYECLLYGTRALVYGLPIACGVTYLIYLSVLEGYPTDFYLPWTAILIAVCSVFAVVFITMLYAMGKIKKDNPIDALKNENL